MKWMLMPLRRYADFSGRSRRKEFWMFFLFQFLLQIAFLVLMILLLSTATSAAQIALDPISQQDLSGSIVPIFLLMAIWGIFWLAMLIPNAALVVRRFNDQGVPGFVGILLYIGTVIFTLPGTLILIFISLEGKKGDNHYGRDPKMAKNVGDVFS